MKGKLIYLLIFTIFLTSCNSRENHLHAITEKEGHYNFSFVDNYIKEKQIIFLGESTHTAKEFTGLKAELVKYLHEEHGFSMLLMESGRTEIEYMNSLWEVFDNQFMLEQMILPAWHTSDMEDLIGYVRTTNLQLKGLDPLPVVGNARRVERMPLQQFIKTEIESQDKELAEEFLDLESRFIEYMRNLPYEREKRADLEEAQLMKNRYGNFHVNLRNLNLDENIEKFIEGRMAVLDDFTPEFLANYNIDTVYQEYYSRRDLAMFNELQAILEQSPDEKIIVWAHNGHINKNFPKIEQTNEWLAADYTPPPLVLGTLANESFGEISYFVGLYFNQGEIVIDRVRRIEPKRETNELEYVLSEYGHEKLFVDLNESDAEWVNKSLTAYDDGVYDYKLVPKEQFDAIIYIETVTPNR